MKQIYISIIKCKKRRTKKLILIATAGQKGQITIATNMAGRGTDILLGEGVHELGGLHVIGTERHESRRVDNQLKKVVLVAKVTQVALNSSFL